MLPARGITWDKAAEVVVVGYGLAGAVAAITAHDLGASVILLEKQRADSRCTCSSSIWRRHSSSAHISLRSSNR